MPVLHSFEGVDVGLADGDYEVAMVEGATSERTPDVAGCAEYLANISMCMKLGLDTVFQITKETGTNTWWLAVARMEKQQIKR